MGEHNALGEARGARGVLHIADVAWAYCRRHSRYLLAADELVSRHSLVEGEGARLLIADGNNVP